MRTASASFSEFIVGNPPGLAEGVMEGMASPQGFSSTSATPCHTRQRLREYTAERMRMSHIYQPLML
ncbi:hypothetical protein KQ305_01935 [Synechococcus sp. CS-1332]|nr:hypothetical protein [Synechococcus sp. CS-1332]